jgi:hypothetical protein
MRVRKRARREWTFASFAKCPTVQVMTCGKRVAAVAFFCCILGSCASDDDGLTTLRNTSMQQFTEASNKCQKDMEPVRAQLKTLSVKQRATVGLDPDGLARVLLPCQKEALSDACVDAQGTVAERLDSIYGTSNAASVLPDCTRMVKDYRTAHDVLLIR